MNNTCSFCDDTNTIIIYNNNSEVLGYLCNYHQSLKRRCIVCNTIQNIDNFIYINNRDKCFKCSEPYELVLSKINSLVTELKNNSVISQNFSL